MARDDFSEIAKQLSVDAEVQRVKNLVHHISGAGKAAEAGSNTRDKLIAYLERGNFQYGSANIEFNFNGTDYRISIPQGFAAQDENPTKVMGDLLTFAVHLLTDRVRHNLALIDRYADTIKSGKTIEPTPPDEDPPF